MQIVITSHVKSLLQVPPIDYLRQVTLDLGGATGTAAESLPGNSSTRSSVATLIKRFNEVNFKLCVYSRPALVADSRFSHWITKGRIATITCE